MCLQCSNKTRCLSHSCLFTSSWAFRSWRSSWYSWATPSASCSVTSRKAATQEINECRCRRRRNGLRRRCHPALTKMHTRHRAQCTRTICAMCRNVIIRTRPKHTITSIRRLACRSIRRSATCTIVTCTRRRLSRRTKCVGHIRPTAITIRTSTTRTVVCSRTPACTAADDRR
jgi:hypothetical protein